MSIWRLENGVSQATRYAVTGQSVNDPNNAGQNSRARTSKPPCVQATPDAHHQRQRFQFYNLTKAASGAGGPSDVIRVTVNYGWTAFTPLIRPIFIRSDPTERLVHYEE